MSPSAMSSAHSALPLEQGMDLDEDWPSSSSQNPPNPISFDAFCHTVLNQPLDQLYKYHDEEGEEVDLEETFDGDSSESDEEEDHQNIDTDDTTDKGDQDGDDEIMPDASFCNGNEDKDEDTDNPSPQPTHSSPPYSRYRNSELTALVRETQATLENLSKLAQPFVEEQPLSTQIILSNQTAELFRNYATHGSESRLFEAIGKFLSAGEEVRVVNPEAAAAAAAAEAKLNQEGNVKETKFALPNGGRARLRFAPVGEGIAKGANNITATSRMSKSRTKMKRKANDESQGNVRGGSDARSFKKRAPARETNLSIAVDRHRDPKNDSPALKSPMTVLSDSVNDISLQKGVTVGQSIVDDASSSSSGAWPPTHTSNGDNAPHPRSVTTDADTNSMLKDEPFAPCGLTISWATSNNSSLWPRGLLDHLNRIFHLYNGEATFLLSYFSRKYQFDNKYHSPRLPDITSHHEMKASPPDPDPPYALFRLAISEHLNSQIGTILQPASQHALGLPPETRRLFREIFMHGKQSALNAVEKEILARMAGTDTATVDRFWKMQLRQTRAWAALRVWCARRDSEKLDHAVEEGRF